MKSAEQNRVLVPARFARVSCTSPLRFLRSTAGRWICAGLLCAWILSLAGSLQAQIQLFPPAPPQSPPTTANKDGASNNESTSRALPPTPSFRTAQQTPLTIGTIPQRNDAATSAVGSAATTTLPTTTPAAATSDTSPASVSDVLTITPDAVITYIQQLQVAADLDANLKQTLITTYEAILTELKSRADSEKVTKEFIAAYEAASAATAEAKRRKENPRPRVVFFEGTLPSITRIETLQSYQLEVQGLVQAATDGRTRVEAAIVSRDARRKEIPRLIAEDKASITKLNEELALPAVEGVDPRIREASTLLLRAKLLALSERVRRLEQEQRTYDAEVELLPVRKEVFLAEEKFQQARLKEINEELSKRREIHISKQRAFSESLVTHAAPELKARTEQLVKRSDDWLQLAKQNSTIRLDVDAARAELKLWSDRYKIMTDRISPESSRHVSNFNSWVGLMLRKQRTELPDIGELSNKLRDYQTRILATESLILELDDWKAASAFNEEATQPSSEATSSVDYFASASYHEQQRILDSLEHKLVDEFLVDANTYFDNLFNLAETNQRTIDQVNSYRSFIDEHILWIRSSEPVQLADAQQLWPAVRWLFDLQNWRSIPSFLWIDIQNHPWGYLFGSICYVLLLLNLKRCKIQSHRLGVAASKPNCTSFLPTAKVFAYCVLLSSPLAILHLVIGWRLMNCAEGSSFATSIAMGLMVSARYFFPLEMLRQISRAGGLAENHFQWSSHSTQRLRRNLRWFIDLAIPTVSVVGIISQFGESKFENSLGRLSYCILMSLCFCCLLIVIHPRRGVFSDFLSRNAGGWIDRLKYIWYFGLAAGPIALMTMSLMGYHYTSIRLAMLLHTTFTTLVGLLLLANFIRRWLLLRRRVLVVSQARQRLEEARRRDPGATSPAPTIDTHTDLAQINAQTVRLVRSTLLFAAIAAVAFIWSGVLPAVGVLESIRLWPVEGVNPGERTWITLSHLFFAIPIAIMTFVAARNLPGLLEIALLQHLPIENAVRYAIASISRYTILILGIAMTFHSIGMRWASIQWLVAALGVGLGFGLQEIFANFVSGLILLFEQPIRVGDVITLGDTTGSVSRIRMRATTVTNFDQQELIIPNKDLITGRLLNWTLSDSTNRMIIQVGISQESDPDLACRLLREVCVNHPNVLNDPAPSAYFEQFGDGNLELKARFYLANLEQRLPTRHDLHTQIRNRFAQAGIEISFPQRNLHLRTVPRELASILTGDSLEPAEARNVTQENDSHKSSKTRISNPILPATETNAMKTGHLQGD